MAFLSLTFSNLSPSVSTHQQVNRNHQSQLLDFKYFYRTAPRLSKIPKTDQTPLDRAKVVMANSATTCASGQSSTAPALASNPARLKLARLKCYLSH